MNHIKENMEKFVGFIRKGYAKDSPIQLFCEQRKRDYNPEIDLNRQFIEVPIRIHIEEEDFMGSVDNQFLGEELGESLVMGEFNYLIHRFNEIKTKEEITLDYSTFLVKFKKLPIGFNPRYLLVPIKYYSELHNLEQGEVKFEYDEEGQSLRVRGFKVRIIWSSNIRPFDRIYLIGRDAITWISKQKKDMKPMQGISRYNKEFDAPTDKVSVIYRETKDQKFDFIARVVAYAEIDEKKVKRFKISEIN